MSRRVWLGVVSGALEELSDGLSSDGSAKKRARSGKRCSSEDSAAREREVRCDRSCLAFSASLLRAGGTPALFIVHALDTKCREQCEQRCEIHFGRISE